MNVSTKFEISPLGSLSRNARKSLIPRTQTEPYTEITTKPEESKEN